MIIEAIGLVRSLYPFIKEVFLWRDGAEVGKPITSKHLLRRKIATWVTIASLLLNYVLLAKLYTLASKVIRMDKKIAELTAQTELVKPQPLNSDQTTSLKRGRLPR